MQNASGCHGVDSSTLLPIKHLSLPTERKQAANLAGFRASEDPRFEAGIPDFMNGILNFSVHFNVVHRKVDWRNPKMKSLNSMPGKEVAERQGYFYVHDVAFMCLLYIHIPERRRKKPGILSTRICYRE